MDDVGHEVVILDGFAQRGELIGEAPHGGEVGGHRLIALLRVDQRRTDVVDAAEWLRREHARQRHPVFPRRGGRGHRDEHLLGEVLEQVSKDLLVLPHPDRMERIRPRGLLNGGVLGGGDFGRFGSRAADVVEDANASQLRHDLRLPQNVVGAGELLRDPTAERRLEGGGGRHGCCALWWSWTS